jgi:hypothetical protein
MEICKVRSMADLVTLYGEKDKDHNGKLEPNEIGKLEGKDKNGDGALSPWEVMEAANACAGEHAFSAEEIEAIKQQNDAGESSYSFTLEKKASIQGIPLRSGTEIRLYKWRMSSMVSKGRTTLQGIPFAAEHSISFHDNMKVNTGRLASDVIVAGIPLREDTDVRLYSNGVPEQGTTAREFTRQGATFSSGSNIALYETGRVRSGTLARDVDIAGRRFKGGERIEFHANGQVASGVLAAKATIQGTSYEAGCKVEFHENGALAAVTLTADKTIQGIPVMSTTDERQPKLRRGESPNPAYLGNHQGAHVRFHKNGRIAWALIGKPFVYRHKMGKRDVPIALRESVDAEFYADGRIKACDPAPGVEIEVLGKKMAVTWSMTFHPNGMIDWLGGFSGKVKIGNYEYKGEHGFNLYENGSLKSGTITGGKIYEITLPDNMEIAFDRAGTVVSATPPRDIAINRYIFQAGKPITFWRGKLHSGFLKKDLALMGKSPKGNEYPLILRSDQAVAFHDFAKRDIAGGFLKEDVEIDDVRFKAGTWLGIYGGGGAVDRISQGTLAADAKIGGKTYQAGTTLTFSYGGKVLTAKKE